MKKTKKNKKSALEEEKSIENSDDGSNLIGNSDDSDDAFEENQEDEETRLLTHEALLNMLEDLEDEKTKALEHEEKYHAVFDNTGTAMVAYGDNGILSLVNDEFEKLSEMNAEDIVDKKKWSDFVSPEDLKRMKKYHSQRSKGSKKVPTEYKFNFISGKGNIRIINLKLSIIPVTKLRVVSLIDITESKNTEQSLKESEEVFRTIFERTPSLAGLMSTDGKLIKINNSYLSMVGIEEKDVLGKLFWNTPWWAHDKKLQVWLKKSISLAAKGKFIEEEVTHISKTGEERIINFSLSPVKDNSGKINFIVPIGHDFTESKKAERSLKESEERFRDVALSSADWIWEVNEKGIYTFVSGNFKEILGYSYAEMIGKTPFYFMPKEESKRVKNIFGDVVSKKKPLVDIENINISKKGDKKVLLTNGVPMLDKKGNLTGYRGVDNNITERKKAEETLKEAQNKAKEAKVILENSPVVVFLWKNKEGWPVEYVSNNVNKIFGYTALDFISGKVAFEKVVYKNDLEQVGKEVERYSKGKGTKEFERIYRIVDKKGNIKWIEDKTFIRRDSKGKITHYQGIVWEITEKKKSEKDLEEEQKRYKLLLDNSSDIIFSATPEGVLTYVTPNVKQIGGFKPEDLVGRSFFSLLHKGDVLKEKKKFISAIKTGKSYPSKFRVKTKQRKYLWVDEVDKIVKEKGKVVAITGSMRLIKGNI